MLGHTKEATEGLRKIEINNIININLANEAGGHLSYLERSKLTQKFSRKT
jgi:hypothetical protein